MRPRFAIIAAGPLVLLAGCAGHGRPPPHVVTTPAQWDNGPTSQAEATVVDERWWRRLGDPVVDVLVSAAMDDNPTLAQALARVEQARATRDASAGARLPRLDVTAAASRGRQSLATAGGTDPVTTTSASVSPSLSWELDLWGRVRRTAQAASIRIDARTADARGARLEVASEIAAGVMRLRACNVSVAARGRDIASRTTDFDLMEARLSLGAGAPAEIAQARSNLASAKTEQLSQIEQCARELDALVAVSGVDAGEIRRQVAASPAPGAQGAAPQGEAGDPTSTLPVPPPLRLALPATLLLQHPSVLAADREAAARWAEIDVARAERLPRIDLAAVVTGQWLDALGTTTSLTTWSAGPQLSAVLFDGGAGAASVRGAEARYREAVAALQAELRGAVQTIEDGLAARASADQRLATSREALSAARLSLNAAESRRRLGAISQFELEDARRQFTRAEESATDAARDQALAWIQLVRASGAAFEAPAQAAALSAPYSPHFANRAQ